MKTDLSPSLPAPRRRRFSLSIRGLMIVVLVLGCVLGRLAYRASVQREAVAVVRAAGGAIEYDWELVNDVVRGKPYEQGWQSWLIGVVGPDYLSSVIGVYLMESKAVDDSVVAQVGRLEHLEWLDFRNCAVTDESLRHLRDLTRLKDLCLWGTKVRGPGLVHLARMSRLRELNLDEIAFANNDLSPIPPLTSLECLLLSGPTITDDGLKALEKMTNLKILKIHHSPVTNAGLVHLRQLHLRHLELRWTKVDDLRRLAPMAELESLDLNGAITDDTAASLAAFPNLRELWIFPGLITDTGLQRLAECKKLTGLIIRGPAFSAQAIAALKATHPWKVIDIQGGVPVPLVEPTQPNSPK